MAVHKLQQQPDMADILLRVSTDRQAGQEHYSLPSQRKACEAFAAKYGWQVYSVQTDTISGDTVNRPGYQAVLDHLDARTVSHVIVYDVDRAGRDLWVGVNLLHACEVAGAQLHIEQMPDLELATGTPTAKTHEMLFSMRLGMASQEKALIRERTQRGRRERVLAGKPLMGPVPAFGYVVTTDAQGHSIGFAPHPDYAPLSSVSFVRWPRARRWVRSVGVLTTMVSPPGHR